MSREGLDGFVNMAAAIVSAYIAKNSVSQLEVAPLISSVHAALTGLNREAAPAEPAEPLKPAVPIKKSYTKDYVICLEDGLKFKSLKRHLRVRYNLTPESYRAKWGLPPDHPIVAPGYAEIRSQMARDMGLGQRRLGQGKKPPR